MKAGQDIQIFVDDTFTPVSHYSGDPLKDKKQIKVKKGEEVPKQLLSHFLQFNKEYLDMSTATKAELDIISVSKPKPIVEPRKYSLESLTVFVNKDKKTAVERLKEILEKEFNYKSSSKRTTYLRNKILNLQDKS